jgi:putative spermidine/putrescine transport system permease protein
VIARAVLRGVSLLTLAYLALPLVVIVGASFTASQFLAFPPKGLSLDWYGRMLSDPSYLAAFAASTWLASAATALAVLLSLPAALAIARQRFPGREALLAMLMSPLVLPHVVLGAAILQYSAALGFMRTFWALLVGHAVIVMPFVLRSVLPQLTAEQQVLEEVAADLGATPWTTFRLVTLPLIRPGLVAGSILAFITSWINVELSIFNTTAELTTIPVKLFNYVQYTIDPSIAAVSSLTIIAAAVVLVILDLVLGLDLLPSRADET